MFKEWMDRRKRDKMMLVLQRRSKDELMEGVEAIELVYSKDFMGYHLGVSENPFGKLSLVPMAVTIGSLLADGQISPEEVVSEIFVVPSLSKRRVEKFIRCASYRHTQVKPMLEKALVDHRRESRRAERRERDDRLIKAGLATVKKPKTHGLEL